MHWSTIGARVSAVMAGLVVACGNSTETQQGAPQPTPTHGQTSFVSADGIPGESSPSTTADLGDESSRDDDATVEEGDIYRVSDANDRILNLNYFRGLQIVDISNLSAPRVVGQARISGAPVEMYQVGNQVYALVNNWHGYYQPASGVLPDQYTGGLVAVIDISNEEQPEVIQYQRVDGSIQTSRLVRDDNKAALYVVAQDYASQTTRVKSFARAADGRLNAVSDLSLGGYVNDIQATSTRLMVASRNSDWKDPRSKVAVLDISSTEGTIVSGATIRTYGHVRKKTDMDFLDNVLRVVSGNSWTSTTNTNHVETFDFTNINNPLRIDHATFGDNEQLFGTIFLEEKAFFVTYLRVDPFHAFEITRDGRITEKSEFIVSGWNDWFKPTYDGRRLIGIGKNDQNQTNTMAVSLYDITDLTNPHPLISRAQIDLERSWSEGQWDDRAFSVLENATSVTSTLGQTIETGLVLLPFSGWDSAERRYISAVQIFTFSENTLTRRGIMEHGSRVRRTFLADSASQTAGNLSNTMLSLHDVQTPDAPRVHASVELTPNYTDLHIFGDYGVRVKDRSAYYSWWGSSATDQNDVLEIYERAAGDADRAPTVTEVQIPPHAFTYKMGDNLAVVSTEYGTNSTVTVTLYDMSDPTTPETLDAYFTTDIQVSYGYGYRARPGLVEDACLAPGCYFGLQPNIYPTGDALVFVALDRFRERQGTRTVHHFFPKDRYAGSCGSADGSADGSDDAKPASCTYYRGSIRCSQLTRLDGTTEPQVCFGQFYRCDRDADGASSCEPVDADAVETEVSTRSFDHFRSWSAFRLHTIDARDPSDLKRVPTIELPQDEEAVTVVHDDTHLYLSIKKPFRLDDDARPFVRHYFREVDFAAAQSPVVGARINIPGQLLSVVDSRILTKDALWGASIVETSINHLELQQNQAVLRGTRRFTDRYVETVLPHGADAALVTHRAPWRHDAENLLTLSVLDQSHPDLLSLSDFDVAEWATLRASVDDKALFDVAGGLLLVDLDDLTSPKAQAYYPMRGWPQSFVVQDSDIVVPAGRFGIYTFDADVQNLP